MKQTVQKKSKVLRALVRLIKIGRKTIRNDGPISAIGEISEQIAASKELKSR